MQRIEPNRLLDGFVTLDRGVDSGRSPGLLEANQVAYAVNATFRGGYAAPRPGFRPVDVSFASGRWQGAAFYDSPTKPGFVASINGGIYFVDPIAGTVQEISSATDRNNRLLPKAYFQQAEEFMIVQDGQGRPLIWNGSSSRRAATDEVPTGTVMAYGMGRLWVTLPNGHYFTAGDLVYGETFATSDLLKFTENDFLTGGGYFTVPVTSGPITAMQFMPQLDTSLGQGPLQVFTENGLFSVRAPVDRETWQALRYPIQTVSLLSYGALSAMSTVAVNGDVWYRARDGVRSLVFAQRQFNEWANTPMSKEMGRVTKYENSALLGHSSAIVFDNRLLMTALPYSINGVGIAHRGLMALDFDPLSSMTTKLPPAWDGLWTGLRFLQVVKGTFQGKERAFAFILDESNAIKLWEITTGDRWDNTTREITWFLETKDFIFRDAFSLKRLEFAEIYRDRIAGTLSTAVKFRPDQHPCWVDWHDWQECASVASCVHDATQCPTVRHYQPQYKVSQRLPQPTVSCDSVTGKPYRHGYSFQLRFQFTGHCRLKAVRLHAYSVQEDNRGACTTDQVCSTLECCDEDAFPSTPTSVETLLGSDDGSVIVTDLGDTILIV